MKKNLRFAFVALFAFSGLAGCSLTGENYYTIDVYSDYVGMEEDLAAHGYYTVDLNSSSAMAAVGLKKVGYCYAVKGKDAKIGGIQLEDSKFNGKSSTRTPAQGHKYVFDKFVGFYGANQQVDLNSVQSNCAVFATFKDELKDYTVTVRDAYQANVFSDHVLYQKTALELKEAGDSSLYDILNTVPAHDPLADPEDYSTWRDPHYIEYTFDKWRFSVEGEKTAEGWTYESESKRSFILLSAEEAVAYRFLEETRVDPYFLLADKSYEVTISYQDRTVNSATGEYEYTSPVSATAQTVQYGEAVDVAALGRSGYTCVGEGKDGNPSRYGDEMNLSANEARAKLPSPVCELYSGGYRGTVVDRNKIEFQCAITLIFVQDAATYDLTFHPDCGDDSVTQVVSIQEGDVVNAPEYTNLPADKSFAQWGVKDAMDNLVPVDLTSINKSCDIYPILVDTTLVNGNLTFAFDSDRLGYCLSEVADAATSIAASDFDLTIFPEHYPLVGIRSVEGPTSAAAKLTSIALPADNDIAWVAHGLFTSQRLYEVADIDLSASKVLALHSYAFRNLARVAEISLPSSLYEVGTSLFQNCSSLTSVKIDLTKEEIAERAFDANWFGGVDESVIAYKA